MTWGFCIIISDTTGQLVSKDSCPVPPVPWLRCLPVQWCFSPSAGEKHQSGTSQLVSIAMQWSVAPHSSLTVAPHNCPVLSSLAVCSSPMGEKPPCGTSQFPDPRHCPGHATDVSYSQVLWAMLHCTGLQGCAAMCSALRLVTMMCSALQLVTMHYSDVQCSAVPRAAQASGHTESQGETCQNIQSTTLYCTVLPCTGLYCPALPSPALHCTALYCDVLFYSAENCTELCHSVLQCTLAHHQVLHCSQTREKPVMEHAEDFTCRGQKFGDVSKGRLPCGSCIQPVINRSQVQKVTDEDPIILLSLKAPNLNSTWQFTRPTCLILSTTHPVHLVAGWRLGD